MKTTPSSNLSGNNFSSTGVQEPILVDIQPIEAEVMIFTDPAMKHHKTEDDLNSVL